MIKDANKITTSKTKEKEEKARVELGTPKLLQLKTLNHNNHYKKNKSLLSFISSIFVLSFLLVGILLSISFPEVKLLPRHTKAKSFEAVEYANCIFAEG